MSVYFFWGDEDFLIDKEVENLKKTVLNSDVNALNYRLFDNPDFNSLAEILSSVGMLFGNLMSKIKCNRYFLEGKKKITLDDKQTQKLIDILNEVPQTHCVVFICPIDRNDKKKPDSRKKLFKEIQKIAQVKEFTAFKPYEDYKILPFLKKITKEKDIQIQDSALTLLIQNSGSYLRDLDNQLEKLKLAAYPDKNITVDLIEKICTNTEDIFALSDLILTGQIETAFNEVTKLLEKSHYLEIFGFLQSSFSKLLKIKILSEQLSSYEISTSVGMHEFVVKKNLQKLKNISADTLVNFKLALTEAEFSLKTGTIDELTAFENVFLSIKNKPANFSSVGNSNNFSRQSAPGRQF